MDNGQFMKYQRVFELISTGFCTQVYRGTVLVPRKRKCSVQFDGETTPRSVLTKWLTAYHD